MKGLIEHLFHHMENILVKESPMINRLLLYSSPTVRGSTTT